MQPTRLAICLLLVGATEVAAQGADSIGRSNSPGPSSPGLGSGVAPDATPGRWADGTAPTCWLGCRGSLQAKAPTEWSKMQVVRQDSLAARTRRRSLALRLGAGESTSGSAAERTSGAGAAEIADGPSTRPATEAEGQRFLIEEWRRSEFEVADSVHHVVLLRLNRLYDSAQGRSVSPDDRLRILRDVDGINVANQVMWFQRRNAVMRTADSTARALGLPPVP
jgi:hypothetical protein